MRQTPMMSDVSEYRELLHQALYDGELSEEMQAKVDERRREHDEGEGRTERGKPLPRKVMSEFEQLQADAEAAREARAQLAITQGSEADK